MGRQARTKAILEVAVEVLKAHHPMTLRQVYYQLVSRQVVENNRSQYQALSKLLVTARREGEIPWEWIEDAIIDLRPGSATFGRHLLVTLTAENRQLLWVPEGFAHGFLTLEDATEVMYQMSRPYEPKAARAAPMDLPIPTT